MGFLTPIPSLLGAGALANPAAASSSGFYTLPYRLGFGSSPAPAAVARGAAAELGFFQELAASLPVQATLQKNALASQKAWDAGGEARARYLADLRAYRDSLR